MKGTLAIHYGLLNMVNQTNQMSEGAHILSRFDELVIQGIYSGPDMVTQHEILRLINKPVWAYIPMSKGGTQTITGVLNEMDQIMQVFSDQGNSDLLKGFFLDEFGFDYTFNDGVTTRNIDRDYQNQAVSGAHQRGKPVFVNAWFTSHVFTPRQPPWYGYTEGTPLADPLVGSTKYTDYVLCESPIITAWTSGSPTYTYTKLVDYLENIQKYVIEDGRNVRTAAIQSFDWSSVLIDSSSGKVSAPQEVLGRMKDYLTLMELAGIEYFGVADVGYGASTNKLFNPLNEDRSPVEDFPTGSPSETQIIFRDPYIIVQVGSQTFKFDYDWRLAK